MALLPSFAALMLSQCDCLYSPTFGMAVRDTDERDKGRLHQVTMVTGSWLYSVIWSVLIFTQSTVTHTHTPFSFTTAAIGRCSLLQFYCSAHWPLTSDLVTSAWNFSPLVERGNSCFIVTSHHFIITFRTQHPPVQTGSFFFLFVPINVLLHLQLNSVWECYLWV